MILRREPVLIYAAFVAVLNVLIAFGVLDLNAAQTNALIALIAAALGIITRKLVTPLANPRDAQAQQLTPDAPPGDGTTP